MDTDEPSAAKPQPLWSARTCPRFRQATCRRRMREGVQLSRAAGRGPALATSRQSGKAVTSHRTPNSRRAAGPARRGRSQRARIHQRQRPRRGRLQGLAGSRAVRRHPCDLRARSRPSTARRPTQGRRTDDHPGRSGGRLVPLSASQESRQGSAPGRAPGALRADDGSGGQAETLTLPPSDSRLARGRQFIGALSDVIPLLCRAATLFWRLN